MAQGLPLRRLVNTTTSLTPIAPATPNLNTCLILGDSDVIDVQTRIASYSSIGAIATAFGTNSPEYAAAVLYFAQKPQPEQVYVGKWASAATAGRLIGAALTPTQQLLANFTAITAGSLKIAVDGGAQTAYTGMNFAGVSNLNGVATIINTTLAGAATCVWTGTAFQIKSPTTGAASAITFPTAPGSGTDITIICALSAALGAIAVHGIVAETALAAVTLLDGLSTYWYGLTIASAAVLPADHEAVSAYIEASANKHIYGVNTADPNTLVASATTDVGYVLSLTAPERTTVWYSSTSAYPAASMFGRLGTVDLTQSNSAITMMYQQGPGMTAEILTSAQAAAADAKRVNYLALYSNGASLFETGVMSGPYFIDEVFGSDWLADFVQTTVFDILFTAGTKIPQTDDGNHTLVNAITAASDQAVQSGLAAPGTWQSAGFGQITEGEFLPAGYYIYCPPISSQSPSDRAARKSVPIQEAIKFAGAIHTADIALTFNR